MKFYYNMRPKMIFKYFFSISIKILLKIKFMMQIKIKCKYKWYGNDYGGFYICPLMLYPPTPPINRQIIVYSAGIGEDISFDLDISSDFSCKIFAFDPTPKSIEWIKKQKMPDNFLFFPYGISDKTEEKVFHLSNTPLDISASIFIHEYTSDENHITVQMKSLEDIAKEQHHSYIDILKMDIEGSEFAIIEKLPQNIIFGQIVVEFHERFFENSKDILNTAIKQLKKSGYYCFAISEHGDEYSFINKNEYKKRLCGRKS